MIGFPRAGSPPLREHAHALVGARVLLLRGDTPRDAQALLDDRVVAEIGEALRRPQHALDRTLAPGAEERGEIRLARLRVGDRAEASTSADPPVGFADRHHAFPVAALEGGRVR